jgi:mRNA-degrading endonuclease toxin of MazEF toxin-antitoxin module
MHVNLKESFLRKNTILLLEQIRTIDKRRLLKKIGCITKKNQNQIDKLLDKNFYNIKGMG